MKTTWKKIVAALGISAFSTTVVTRLNRDLQWEREMRKTIEDVHKENVRHNEAVEKHQNKLEKYFEDLANIQKNGNVSVQEINIGEQIKNKVIINGELTDLDIKIISDLKKNAKTSNLSNDPELLKRMQEYFKVHQGVNVPEEQQNVDAGPSNFPESLESNLLPFDINFDSLDFIGYAGLSVMLNTLWILMLLSILLFNNFINKSVQQKSFTNKYVLFLLNFYKKFTTIENYMVIIIIILPVFSLFYVGYMLFTY